MERSMAVDIDLDVGPATVPAPWSRARLPWILLALAFIALLGGLAGLVGEPRAQTSRPPVPAALPEPNPAIDATWSDGAISAGPTVLRDVAGQILAVVMA